LGQGKKEAQEDHRGIPWQNNPEGLVKRSVHASVSPVELGASK